VEIKTEITKDDLVQFRLFEMFRSRQAWWRRLVMAILPPAIGVSASFGLIAFSSAKPIQLSTTLLSMVLFIPSYAAAFHWLTKRRIKKELDSPSAKVETDSMLGESQIVLSPDGLTITHGSKPSFMPWAEVLSVVGNGDYGYIYTNTAGVVIVPQRCFPSEEEFRVFVKAAIIFHWNREPAVTPEAVVDVGSELTSSEQTFDHSTLISARPTSGLAMVQQS
jgi:hypothetical protein